MAYQTIVAVYDTAEHAQAAVKALQAGGIAPADISVFDDDRLKTGGKVPGVGPEKAGLWHRLFGSDLNQHEAAVYGQTVQRGGVVVSARVLDSEVAHASGILDLHHPIDVHDRAVTTGIAPAARVETIESAIAEEQLQVGKQMVEDGSTRVRRFTTERDVSADVTLHEEHAQVLRRAVTDPNFVGNIDWADAQIEVVETAEHALVGKTARIVEEVALRKVGTDHVETVHDKLRRQQVEIERRGADGKVTPPRGA